jgi:hypothetical protein
MMRKVLSSKGLWVLCMLRKPMCGEIYRAAGFSALTYNELYPILLEGLVPIQFVHRQFCAGKSKKLA